MMISPACCMKLLWIKVIILFLSRRNNQRSVNRDEEDEMIARAVAESTRDLDLQGQTGEDGQTGQAEENEGIPEDKEDAKVNRIFERKI